MSRILALDTATGSRAVALWRDGTIVAERNERPGLPHAAGLTDLVAEVLHEAGEHLASGDAVAVAIGPGSFTGLRIALAFAKGLAFASRLRIVGVPTLDARAIGALPWDGRLCTVLDARKREVYACVYERGEGKVVRLGAPRAVSAERLAREIGGPCSFVGDAVEPYGALFQDILGPGAVLLASDTHPPTASAVARLAAARLAGDPAGDDLAILAPEYLRPPEAELKQSDTHPSARVDLRPFVDKVEIVY